MGELADQVINGERCSFCGVPLPSDFLGAPRYCSANCQEAHLGPYPDKSEPHDVSKDIVDTNHKDYMG